MITFGLIGYPLSHSWSQDYFSEKFRRENVSGKEYRLLPIESIDDFPALIKQNPSLVGLNVTIPYKEKVIPFIDSIDDTVSEIGALNTIKISRNKEEVFLKGYNTDAEGFLLSADFSNHSKALILGTGGAAKAVNYALKKLNISALFVSRNPTNSNTIGYKDLSPQLLNENTLIVNATPIGMYPETGHFPPIPYQFITKKHFLYDLVYNPPMTQFLQKGLEKGVKIENGLRMFQLQAELSYQIWTSEM